MDADLGRVAQGLPVAHETEEAATAVLSGAGLEAATQVVPTASRGAGTRLPPPYYGGARPRRPLWPWLLAARLPGLAGVAGYFVYHEVDQRLSANATVQVPFVQGITEGLARDKITNAGLEPIVQRRPSEKVPLGIVFDQNPEGGNHANKGDQVVLTVSLGKPKVEVPDVRKQSVQDAVGELTKRGLNPKEYEVTSSQAAGNRDRPVAGTGNAGREGHDGPHQRLAGPAARDHPLRSDRQVPVGRDERAPGARLQRVDATAGLDQAAGDRGRHEPEAGIVRAARLAGHAPRLQGAADGLRAGRARLRRRARGADDQGGRVQGRRPVAGRSDQAQDGVVLSESPEQNTQATLGTPVTISVGHYVPPVITGPTGPSGRPVRPVTARRQKVAVVTGGRSSEHEIALASARS